MTLTRAKWSVEDYHRMIQSGILVERAVELLQGEIVEMAPERPLHAHLYSKSAIYLAQKLADRADIRPAAPITLSDRSEPEPDLAIVQPLDYTARHPGPGDIFWVIEFSDTSLSTDLAVKSRIYGSAGIPEYWVVDLRARRLIQMTGPGSQGYSSRVEWQQGEIRPLAFPDVVISVEFLLGITIPRV